MGASTSRKTVAPTALPAIFADGLPDHAIAYVAKVIPKGLRTTADLQRLLSRSVADVLNGRIDIKTAKIIGRQARRLLRAPEQRLG